MARDIAPTVAQQIFATGSGIAGGLAGFVLASRLSGQESVRADRVLLATTLSFAFTFGATFLIAEGSSNQQ